jgi:methylphosphotriester-DNA--protein-cysteine methyltransferase
MRYAEYLPGPRLAPFVRCYWVLECPAHEVSASPERILPDGCAEIVVHYGDPFRRLDENGVAISQRRALFAGQIERFLLLVPEGRVGMFGVRFEPAGARPFVHVALSELVGQVVSLGDVFGGDAALFEERLLEAKDDAARVRTTERCLADRLDHGRSAHREVVLATRRLLATDGRIGTEELKHGLFGGRRQLERAFRDHVGLSPKRLARIVRFQSVFRRLEANPAADWVHIAIDCGYYDQSHLHRDFRDFAGETPLRFASGSHPIADCFLG